MAEGYSHGKVRPVDPDAEAAGLAEGRQPGEFTVTPEIHAALIAAGWTPPPSLAERVRSLATRDRTRG